MSIRLNKAIRELNIGLQTAVEFLEKRSDLGEVRADLSFKLSDGQYNALVSQFRKDKEVKGLAEKLFQKHPKEKKRPAEKKENKVETIVGKRQEFKPLGKIELDSLGKGKKSATVNIPNDKPAVEQKAAAESLKPGSAVEKVSEAKPEKKEMPTAEPKHEPKREPKEEHVQEVNVPEKPVAKNEQQKPDLQEEASQSQHAKYQDVKSGQEAAQPSHNIPPRETKAMEEEKTVPEDDRQSKLFTLKSEKALAPKVNVLGKIDLDALNQSTRPKKKTKEEKRREREEKNQSQHGANGEKKKRARITKERVDIEAAGKQQQNHGNKGGGAHNANSASSHNAGGKKKNRKRNQRPLEVNEEDVARQVKETLARLTNKTTFNKKGAKYRKEKRDAAQEMLREQQAEERAESKTLKLTEFVTVSELATMMNVEVTQVIGTCMSIGVMVSINQRLDAETINLVAEEFGFKTEYVSAEVQEAITEEEDDENDLVSRAPIVTVMGHVDHGKTSLLDHIRNTNVIAGEAGGITQHIGAYNVTLKDGRQITFLDTPGHEAFTAMRARGAQVTDIAIIIVAADDSVMPTTREAIAHAQAANVPMVFAINKIDKPGANPDKIREDLANMNLLVEEWGGKYQCQEISAKKGIGVEELLEKVLLEAEMLDLKANPNRKASGSIIESSLDKGRGYVSTVLVSNGTLQVGDNVIAGTSWGRIKAMFNERNQRIDMAKPAEPAIILGLNGAPTAGDGFHVLETEQEARDIANKRLQLQREQGLRTQKRLTLSDISHRIALGSFKELNIIVKGDTDGSIEALSDSFIKLSTEKIKVDVIYKAVGQISENDVTLADASDAIIVGFQVRPSAAARRQAEQEGVEINTYSVIYDAIEDVKSAMEGMLDKVVKEVVTGQVEVREVYRISKVGTVAGAYVTEGKVHRTDKARLIRDGIVVHTGAINALKRFKDDVKEVATNFECGISLVNFNDILQGDIIETFSEIEVKQKL
ncbi:MAG: translation initiation factor IF-2 [Prevotella sp.]|nr:translation initiation factor IF-2 [Prevotella sp.]